MVGRPALNSHWWRSNSRRIRDFTHTCEEKSSYHRIHIFSCTRFKCEYTRGRNKTSQSLWCGHKTLLRRCFNERSRPPPPKKKKDKLSLGGCTAYATMFYRRHVLSQFTAGLRMYWNITGIQQKKKNAPFGAVRPATLFSCLTYFSARKKGSLDI